MSVHSDNMGFGAQYKHYQTNNENNETNAKNWSDPTNMKCPILGEQVNVRVAPCVPVGNLATHRRCNIKLRNVQSSPIVPA